MLYYIITYYIILYYIILYYQKGTPPGPTKYIARNLCYTYIIFDIYINIFTCSGLEIDDESRLTRNITG